MPGGEEETGPERKPSGWVRQRESCLLRRNSEKARETGQTQLTLPREGCRPDLGQTGLEEKKTCGALIAHIEVKPAHHTKLQADTALVPAPSDSTITSPASPTLGSQLLAI